MSKFTYTPLTTLTNESSAVSQINQNFASLQSLLDTLLSRDGSSPNTMSNSLDMNSQRILNLPEPLNNAEPARLIDIGNAVTSASAAAASATAAAASAVEAENSSESAAVTLTQIDAAIGSAGQYSGYADARWYGVKADAVTLVDASITQGQNTLTSTSRPATQVDVGKVVSVARAGIAGGPLLALVSSISSGAYVLNVAATSTVSGAMWSIGTDNSDAISRIATDADNLTVLFPAGQILVNPATSIVLSGISLQGQSIPQNRTAAFDVHANQGTTFLIVGTSVTPFTIKQSVRITGLTFFYPGQDGQATSPVTYAPLFMDTGTEQLSDFTFENSNVINCFDFFTQNPAMVVMGAMRITGCNIYAINRAFSVASVGETCFVDACLFSAGVFYFPATASPSNLGKWSVQNGFWMYVFGDGTATTASTKIVGGFAVCGGTTINGFQQVVAVDNGWLDETHFDKSTDMNAVQQVCQVNASGLITRTSFSGRMYPNGSFGLTTSQLAFVFDGTAGGAGGSGQGDVVIDGSIVGASSGFAQISGTNLINFDAHGLELYNYGSVLVTDQTSYIATVNNPYCHAAFTSMKVNGSNPGSQNYGILIQNCASCLVAGCTAYHVYFFVDTSGLASGQVNVTGNTTTETQSNTTLLGTLSTNVFASGNSFDKPNPLFDAAIGQLGAWASLDLQAAYQVMTDGGTYTFDTTNHSVQLDAAAGVSTYSVTLPSGADILDGWLLHISTSETITTLSINAASGDSTVFSGSALAAGASVSMIFRKGIGASSPNGKWFAY